MIRNFVLTCDSGKVTVTAKCTILKEQYSVTVDEKDWTEYTSGKLCQRAFPYLSRDDREFLISGISPEGWKLIFGGCNAAKH